jgi:hypothetical protein
VTKKMFLMPVYRINIAVRLKVQIANGQSPVELPQGDFSTISRLDLRCLVSSPLCSTADIPRLSLRVKKAAEYDVAARFDRVVVSARRRCAAPRRLTEWTAPTWCSSVISRGVIGLRIARFTPAKPASGDSRTATFRLDLHERGRMVASDQGSYIGHCAGSAGEIF